MEEKQLLIRTNQDLLEKVCGQESTHRRLRWSLSQTVRALRGPWRRPRSSPSAPDGLEEEGPVPYLESEPSSWGFPALGPSAVLWNEARRAGLDHPADTVGVDRPPSILPLLMLWGSRALPLPPRGTKGANRIVLQAIVVQLADCRPWCWQS